MPWRPSCRRGWAWEETPVQPLNMFSNRPLPHVECPSMSDTVEPFDYTAEFIANDYRIGGRALEYMRAACHHQYERHKLNLPECFPDDEELIFNEFWAAYAERFSASLANGDGRSPDRFEHYVTFMARRFYLKGYDRSLRGHVTNALHNRLKRDPKRRFDARQNSRSVRDVQSDWKHKDCGPVDSSVPLRELAEISDAQPFDFKAADPSKPNSRIQYGGRGQLGDMMAAVLLAALGYRPQSDLTELVMRRIPSEYKQVAYDSDRYDTSPSSMVADLGCDEKVARFVLELERLREQGEDLTTGDYPRMIVETLRSLSGELVQTRDRDGWGWSQAVDDDFIRMVMTRLGYAPQE